MDGQIAPEVMDERLQRLQAALDRHSAGVQPGHRVGKTCDVLVERKGTPARPVARQVALAAVGVFRGRCTRSATSLRRSCWRRGRIRLAGAAGAPSPRLDCFPRRQLFASRPLPCRRCRTIFAILSERSAWPAATRADNYAALRPSEDRRDASRRARAEVEFDEQAVLGALFGEFDANLVQIENRLGVYIARAGTRCRSKVPKIWCGRARDVLKACTSGCSQGQELDAGHGRVADRHVVGADARRDHHGRRRPPADHDPHPQEDDRPALRAQIDYMRALAQPTTSSSRSAPAGTGKTYLAVAQAVSQLMTGSVQRLILVAPRGRGRRRSASCPAT